ncbi:MAG: PAS domain S-box protein, partial [Mycobacteriaceae bacterium]
LILSHWHDRRVLLIDAMLARTDASMWGRDTGSMGYDITTLLTMRCQDLAAPETVGEELKVVADILAGRRDSYRAIKECVHAGGHRIWGDLSLSCIRRPDGEVENLIAQIVDITEFRKAGQW